MAFDLDAFIAGVNNDVSKSRNTKDFLNRVLMSAKTNQGTIQFLPVMSKYNGNFYAKFPRVMEFYGETSLLDSGEAWYRVLPLEFYGDLNPDELELYTQVKKLLDTINDSGELERAEFRVRNYSIFFGVPILHKNTEGAEVEDYIGSACLLIFPALAVIDAFGTAINAKIETMKGKKDWIPKVLAPVEGDRQGAMVITFKKSAGVGYDSSVNFEFNSVMNTVVEEGYVIPEEILSKFDDVLPVFMGWNYDRENHRAFNATAFKELRDQLQIRIKLLGDSAANDPAPADSSATYENKNNLAGSQPAVKAPF